MKVAIIDPVGGHGGMDFYDYGLSYGLSKNNVDVFYFTCSSTKSRAFKNVKQINSFEDVWVKNKISKGYYFFKGYLKSFKEAKRLKCDIFHFHFFDLGFLNFLVILLAYFFNSAKFITLHDVNSFYKKTIFSCDKFIVKLIHGVIVHNKESKNEFLNKKLDFNNINIIPHGNYLPFVKMLPLPKLDSTIKLLFFGQIKEVKGLDILLKALKIVINKNQNYKLVIAGRPWKTDEERYKELIKDLNLEDYVECHFRFIKEKELKDFFEKSDVVILPYKKIYQSGVQLLSMSYGRCVLSSDLKPFKEIVEDNVNGFLFKSEDETDLADKLLNIDRESIISCIKNSNKIITSKFNWVNIGKKTIAFYNSCN